MKLNLNYRNFCLYTKQKAGLIKVKYSSRWWCEMDHIRTLHPFYKHIACVHYIHDHIRIQWTHHRRIISIIIYCANHLWKKCVINYQ